jgi:hypothetical protein
MFWTLALAILLAWLTINLFSSVPSLVAAHRDGLR